MSSKRSRIHPKYKTKYTVTNWPTYDRSLVRRGDVTFWLSPDAIAGWDAKPAGRRGGQQKYSDLAIETALTLRLVFHLPLRQVEGFLGSLGRCSRSWTSISMSPTTRLSRAADDNWTFDSGLSPHPEPSISSSIAAASPSSAKASGPLLSTVARASRAGKSSISGSTEPASSLRRC